MVIDGIRVKGITSDSRQVKKDYVFVAIEGEKNDGNNFIDLAIEKGAAIIYTEKDLERDTCIIKRVKNTRRVLAQLCNEFYNYPSEKLFLIGITGTNGKTTISNLIYHIVSKYGIKCGLIGTLNIKINGTSYPSQLTTPLTEDIYYYLGKAVAGGTRIMVMEVSSHGLKQERVHGIKFDLAIHTNISKDHFNYHKTIDDYVASKKQLFDNLGNNKIALINDDDNYGSNMVKDNRDILVVTYGLGPKSTVNASSIDIDIKTSFNYCLQRTITTLSGKKIEPFDHPISSNLLGQHNIYNALSAITTCLLIGIPMATISSIIGGYRGVTRRMEIIYKEDYMVIDDFCHNPSSYEAVFNTIQNLQYKQLYIVNGIRGNRGKYINYENAKILKQWVEILNVKKLIITDSLDYIDRNNIGRLEERESYFNVFSNSSFNLKYKAFLRDAIGEIIREVQSGDMVLLLGAQSMNEGKNIFSNLAIN